MNGVSAFEMHLHAKRVAGILEPLTEPPDVGFYYKNVSVASSNLVVVLSVVSCLVLCLWLNLMCSLFKALGGTTPK